MTFTITWALVLKALSYVLAAVVGIVLFLAFFFLRPGVGPCGK